MEEEFESTTDSELHRKIVDTVRNCTSEAVTLIEGFVSVQISGNAFRHVHISYRDLPTQENGNTSTPEAASPRVPTASRNSPGSRKVSRRKAYMPTKCDGRGESEDVAEQVPNRRPLLYYRERKPTPRREEPEPKPPCDELEADQLRPQTEEDDIHSQFSFDQADGQLFEQQPPQEHSENDELSQQFHSPAQEVKPVAEAEPSPPLSINCLAVDSDPIGLLNAESIQASMNQVMRPAFPVFPLASFNSELQVPPLSFNTVIPLPSLITDGTLSAKLKPRVLPEQRKIKPKPIMIGPQGVNRTTNVSPYTRPPHSLTKRTPNKEFSCNQCHLKFKSLHNLTEHTTTVHLCFRCTTCNSKFTQRSNLQRHSLKHLGFKPFKCAICMKDYYRKDHLVRHVEVSHPGSEPKASILNVLPSAECLRIIEESQAEAQNKKAASAVNGDVGSATTSATSSAKDADLCDRLENGIQLPRVERDDIFDLEMDPSFADNPSVENDHAGDDDELEEELEEEVDDEEEEEAEEDDFNLENSELMLPEHFISPSSSVMAGRDCSVARNLVL